jgi:hypothetical protein
VVVGAVAPGMDRRLVVMPLRVNGLFMSDTPLTKETVELAETLYKTPALVRHGVRCGKAACHCNDGSLHGPYAFLYWRDERGRQRRRYVRKADVEQVERIVQERQRKDRAARQDAFAAHAELHDLRRWLRALERGTHSECRE